MIVILSHGKDFFASKIEQVIESDARYQNGANLGEKGENDHF